MAQIEESVARYLQQFDTIDRAPKIDCTNRSMNTDDKQSQREDCEMRNIGLLLASGIVLTTVTATSRAE